jgi:transcriptional regulator with XRE-family HTH domain
MTGQELKQLRKKLGCSQWAMAKRLGISQGSVTNYENEYTAIPEDINKELEGMKFDIIADKIMEEIL